MSSWEPIYGLASPLHWGGGCGQCVAQAGKQHFLSPPQLFSGFLALLPPSPAPGSNTARPRAASSLRHRIGSLGLPSFILFNSFERDVKLFGQLSNLSCCRSLKAANKTEPKGLHPPFWQVWLNCLGMIHLYYSRAGERLNRHLCHHWKNK